MSKYTLCLTLQALKVQIIRPVKKVDHDERKREGDSGVVVYVVGVLYVTAVYVAEHFADGGDNSEAPVGGLRRRRLGFRLTACRAGRPDSKFCGGGSRGRSLLLASLGPIGVSGDGVDDAVHLLVKVVHRVAVL